MKELRQKFDGKHFFTSILAMKRISTEVPIVDVETADKEIAQDVNEDYLQGKVRTIKTLCTIVEKFLAYFLMKIDRNIISSLQYSLLTLRASWLV